jgi:protein-tyrosine phosphatase
VLALDRRNLADLRATAPMHRRGDVRLLRSFDPDAGTDLDVPDPYYGGDDGFDVVLGVVERACTGLLEHLRGQIDP